MSKSAKWLLIAACAASSGLLVLAAALLFDWPLWVGLFLLLLVIGVLLGGVLVQRLRLRMRERRFLREEQLATADTRRLTGDGGELEAHWKSAIETVRSSHLKSYGNPLYVLPWYLMIGESGSGKTSSLQGAGLAPRMGDRERGAAPTATENCDWWFFEDAIVIDTAGRYALPVDEQRDGGEWRALLRLLTKYRKREPLNGVVVAVAADRLSCGEPESLAERGRLIRRRIDQLMTGLGLRFPVYLLVTKCDLVDGLDLFARLLPEQCLDQPLGMLNDDPSRAPGDFLDTALSVIGSRLRALRLRLLLEPQAKGGEEALLLLPDRFGNLKGGLGAFMEGAFGSSRYQETPMLRGLFFSSGRRNGTPHARSSVVSEPKRGVFLHDLFAKVLPGDRSLVTPTNRAIRWRKVTGNLGLVSWIVFATLLGGLLSFSFLKNLSTIRQMSKVCSRPSELRHDLPGELMVIDRQRQAVLAAEEQNRRWRMPRFGLDESLKVEQELKSRFCRQFRDGILASSDRKVEEAMAALTPAVPDDAYGEYLLHLARRINLLKARRRGVEYQTLKRMPQPGYLTLLSGRDPAAADDLQDTFAAVYLAYLGWRSDSAGLGREIAGAQRWLRRLLALKGGSMQWSVGFVDRHSALAPLTLASFWGGSGKASRETVVAAAFTRKGKERIDRVVGEIEAALCEPRQKTAIAEFNRWYKVQSQASWQRFAEGFPRGWERLKGEREWLDMAARMSTDQGPYFALLKRLAVELDEGEGDLPCWLGQIRQLQLAMAQGGIEQSKAVERAEAGGKNLLVSLEKKIGKDSGARQMESALAVSRAYRDYRAALSASAPAALSRTQAYQAAAQLYGEDPAVGKSPLIAASNASRQLNSALSAGGSGNELVARLVTGPLDFLVSFLRRESAAYLQGQWEELVLAATLGLTGQQAAPAILAPDGLAWKFVKGPAAPFLTRTLRGYRAKEVLGGGVQFEGAFFAFLERGNQVQAAALARQSNYSVGIEGLPTDANVEARVKPHATRLELQCGGSTQSLANLNYPVGRTFSWSPDNCGDVSLQIEVGDLVLVQRYAGPQAFPEFLKSFPGGQRSFTARDFPGEKAALERMGIRYLRVNYKFTGSAAVIKQGNLNAGQVPRNIARSWGI